MNKLNFLCLIMALYSMALSSRNKVKSKAKVVLKMREGSLQKKVFSIISQNNKKQRSQQPSKGQNDDFKNGQALLAKQKAAQEKIETDIKSLKTDAQKINKYPDLFYYEHEMDQDQLSEQDDKNQVAQMRYDSNPQGADPIKDVKEDSMMVKVNRQGLSLKDQQNKIVHLMLNDDNLFFMNDKDVGYRGVEGSIRIQDIFDPTGDNVKMGQCCENIGMVSKIIFGDSDQSESYYCFQVEDTKVVTKQSWKICSLEEGQADEWRQALVMQVLIYGLKVNGIYGLDSLLQFQQAACLNPKGWNYRAQSRWPCMCPDGEQQSPLNIITDDLVSDPIPRLQFNSIKTKSIVAKVMPWETKITGEFGDIIYTDQKRRSTQFKAYEIRFKFPSEHTINGKGYAAEIQIYHTNGESRLAVSFFLDYDINKMSFDKDISQYEEKLRKKGKTMDQKTIYTGMNIFDLLKQTKSSFDPNTIAKTNTQMIEVFSLLAWPKRLDTNFNTEKCIDAEISIQSFLFKDDSFSNSWYSYMGSDTEPPCNEDVHWFVFKDPFIVTKLPLTQMQAVVVSAGTSNNRKTVEQGDREVVYHNQCKLFNKISTILPPNAPVPDATFVEAKTTQHHYAIAHMKTKTIFDEDNTPIILNRGTLSIGLESIARAKIDPEIANQLQDKLDQWQLENKDKIDQRNKLISTSPKQ